ncbi:protoporphyrinogen oxidase [Streptomyces sp. A3M-1-3]|uniref:protoporphyrinogen oxidase n=1 Tax=Streptomyces sp. A3M-1-3 TaxID=2962044 RepID=UPI0020B7B03D|nr:protoporphyrinogen oxidase [Streptomyces sp. A3M-1-3]MCP3820907.1 protoporphyrinogen oxidase [Streptomyces sp. A3M-1-3]
MHEADKRTGHVVVIGGGIAGLAAAHRLLGAGVRVTVLEASGRLGGKLHAGELAGVPVDLGAESMLARRPEAVDLAREVGLDARLQPPATATAALWTRGALRPMPKGHVMGVPGDLAPLAASGVMSDAGLRRIGQDAELPPTEIGDDVAVGEYVAARLGREVVDRLVEPLLGGVYAGDAYRISMRAAVPQLFEVARTHRSLGEGVRELQARTAAGPGATGPVFLGIEGGVGRLPLAVAEACRAAGAEILTGTPVRELTRVATGWRIVTAVGAGAAPSSTAAAGTGGTGVGRSGTRRGGDTAGTTASPHVIHADAVVLATPAAPAADLLAAAAPAAARELRAVEYASMALVTMAFRRADVPAGLTGSGFLVPPVDGRTIKASTFSANKWRWVGEGDPDLFVLRTSVGRYGEEADLKRDDAELVDVSLADLGEAVGLAARPVASVVTRWNGGLPQYPVGHLGRVARIREAVGRLPGLRVCGAVYDGVGIPACIASARRAADEVLATLAPVTGRDAGQ